MWAVKRVHIYLQSSGEVQGENISGSYFSVSTTSSKRIFFYFKTYRLING